ncbi:MAG: leucine-rich repeat domain-containing protein [Lachnospiraceae bacterium]|nr:leucine-rich repeat domain-containing protein [Lachnospiraceae bacterium]
MGIAQEEKAALLERAVINSSVEEISKVCDELGYVEMSAPALGLACRFRGPDVVKVLVEKGATFDFPSTRKIEQEYHCYTGRRYGNYRTNYSLYLLKVFKGGLKRAFCLEGMTFTRSTKRETGNQLQFLPDAERAAVVRYLMEYREKVSFQSEEMLYYAIFFRDTTIVQELNNYGVGFLDIRVQTITEGANWLNGYWSEYILMTRETAGGDYLEMMQEIAEKLVGKTFYHTESTYEIAKKHFKDCKILGFYLAHFKRDKMKKYQIIRDLIDADAAESLPVIEQEGWLKLPKKRDEMIAYATENGKTESLAWLLEYKNRTTDIAVEQEKAEKNMMRELNAAPDSVVSLKKIWSYRKEEDGTLTITNYKGTAIEVIVPERIGKSVVTAIGKAAFTGQTYMKAEDRHRLSVADRFNPRVTDEQIMQHQEITKIVLPETIQYIGAGAFDKMQSLKEIHIPKGVKEIGCSAFSGCRSLKRITIPDDIEKISACTFFRMALEEIVIPGKVREIEKMAFVQCNALKKITIPANVKKIGDHAFSQCLKLEELCIREGVEEIGDHAFGGCISLKTLIIPGTVKVIKKDGFMYCRMLESVQICEGVEEIEEGAFARCQNLKEVFIPKSVRCIRNKNRGQYHYDVFEECPNLTVICPKGSRAEAYCKRKNIKNQFV